MMTEQSMTTKKSAEFLEELTGKVNALFAHLEASYPLNFLSVFAEHEDYFSRELYRGFSTDSVPQVGDKVSHQCFSQEKSTAIDFMFNGHENYKCLIIGTGLYGIDVYDVTQNLIEQTRDLLDSLTLSNEDSETVEDMLSNLLDDETSSYLSEMEVVCSNDELEVIKVEEVEEDEEYIIYVKG